MCVLSEGRHRLGCLEATGTSLLKIKIGFTCIQNHSAADFVKVVPVSRWRDSNVKRLVFEMQLHMAALQLEDTGDGGAMHHDVYLESRNLLSV
jgi:hypothetical protein